jgi:hypothetical protein
VICSVKSDWGLKPVKVLFGGRAYGVDNPTGKLEPTSLMGAWPTVYRHDCLFFRERDDNLSRRVAFGLLALGKSPYGHIVLHHGPILQLVPNRVCMIGTCCLEKLLKVISGLSRLALEVVLNSGDDLFVGVTDLLVVITLVAAGSDLDSLEPPFQPSCRFWRLLCTLAVCLERCPSTAAGSAFTLS